MRIESILPERFEDWLQLRSQLFNDCSPEFHQQEMQWLYESHETGSFLITSDNDELVGLLELSLRNFVDGCLGCSGWLRRRNLYRRCISWAWLRTTVVGICC